MIAQTAPRYTVTYMADVPMPPDGGRRSVAIMRGIVPDGHIISICNTSDHDAS